MCAAVENRRAPPKKRAGGIGGAGNRGSAGKLGRLGAGGADHAAAFSENWCGFGRALRGNAAETMSGTLSGLGDLILTCFRARSRAISRSAWRWGAGEQPPTR